MLYTLHEKINIKQKSKQVSTHAAGKVLTLFDQKVFPCF